MPGRRGGGSGDAGGGAGRGDEGRWIRGTGFGLSTRSEKKFWKARRMARQRDKAYSATGSPGGARAARAERSGASCGGGRIPSATPPRRSLPEPISALRLWAERPGVPTRLHGNGLDGKGCLQCKVAYRPPATPSPDER